MKKRSISMLLALCMTSTLSPSATYAAEGASVLDSPREEGVLTATEHIDPDLAELSVSKSVIEAETVPEEEVSMVTDEERVFIPGVEPEQYELTYPTYESKPGGPRRTPVAGLPSSYSAKDQGRQSAVKDQDRNGLCWAFGTYAALEANMMANQQGEQDFSELHMAYATSKTGGNDNEGWNRAPGGGGNREKSSAYLMRGTALSGTVSETEDAYTKDLSSKTLPERDVTVTQAKSKSYTVQNVRFLTGGEKPSPTEIDVIKQAIMTYGGVGANMLYNDSDEDVVNGAASNYYNASTHSFYRYNEKTKTNSNGSAYLTVDHLVEIAGWDDNWSASNFIQPDNQTGTLSNGAWLVKNSWGSNWGENGYFWISYEDTNFPLDTFCFDGVKPYDAQKTVYEYDYRAEGSSFGVANLTPRPFARVYTMTEQRLEKVESVKVFVPSPMLVEVDVIPDYTDSCFGEGGSYQFPNSVETSYEAPYPGWYTIDLKTPVITGEKTNQFAVAVRLTARSGEKTYIGYDHNANAPTNTAFFFNNSYFKSVEKNITLKAVTSPATDADAIAEAKKDLTWELIKGKNTLPSEIRDNLTLPTGNALGYGTTVTWESQNASVGNDGTVTRSSEVANGNLTATIAKGTASDTVVFDLTVLPQVANDQDAVNNVANVESLWAAIKGNNTTRDQVTETLTLVTSLPDDVTVTWTSSNSAVINPETGAVKGLRFDKGNAPVTLTANLSRGAVTKECSIMLTVPPRTRTAPDTVNAEMDYLGLGGTSYAYSTVWNLIKGDNTGTYKEVKRNLVLPAGQYPETVITGHALVNKVSTLNDETIHDNAWDAITDQYEIQRPAYQKEDISGYFYLRVTVRLGGYVSRNYVSIPLTILPYDGKIDLDAQTPADTTVQVGQIAQTLSVTTAPQGEPGSVAYQWYQRQDITNTESGDDTAIENATGTEFTLPSNLSPGTYYYYCEATAPDAATERSRVATVTVSDEEEDTREAAILNSSSLSLEGDIGVNFYLTLPDALLGTNAYVTLNNRKFPFADISPESAPGITQGKYKFTYNIAVKEMGDPIMLQIYDSNDQLYPLQVGSAAPNKAGFEYSIRRNYFDVAQNRSEPLKNLVDVMYDYGRYAEIYFDYHPDTDKATLKKTTELTAVTADTLSDYAFRADVSQISGLKYSKINLTLESVTTLRLFFELEAERSIEAYAFRVDGKAVTPLWREQDKAYCVEIPGIVAKDLSKTYTVSFALADDAAQAADVYCSALSYAYAALIRNTDSETDDEARTRLQNLQNLVRAMYLYNRASIDYFSARTTENMKAAGTLTSVIALKHSTAVNRTVSPFANHAGNQASELEVITF